ncbi:unnamed protein product [Lactuca saligna]|uniref:Uncharacterized protein n=1 Tax=Lactuca saligna TaxID=75948 RepID=A0AA35ZTY8_LACSI|nr:unnamed protein product [Lactuca saligna]
MMMFRARSRCRHSSEWLYLVVLGFRTNCIYNRYLGEESRGESVGEGLEIGTPSSTPPHSLTTAPPSHYGVHLCPFMFSVITYTTQDFETKLDFKLYSQTCKSDLALGDRIFKPANPTSSLSNIFQHHIYFQHHFHPSLSPQPIITATSTIAPYVT